MTSEASFATFDGAKPRKPMSQEAEELLNEASI